MNEENTKSSEKLMDRRRFLKLGMGAAGGGLVAAPIFAQVADICTITPPQVKGPFYPAQDRDDENTDLTRVNGKTESALGQVHYIKSKVLDEDCAPLAGALVEIWQACESGRYDHDNDLDNPAALDPNFQYWGETRSDADGLFEFKTIKPGSYAAAPDWDRPPHVHVKVTKRGYQEIISQMYFKGEPLNEVDHILKSLSQAEQDSVVVDFQDLLTEPGAKSGEFTVTLKKVRRL